MWSLEFENSDIQIRIIKTVLLSYTKQTAGIYRATMMGLALSLTLQGIEKWMRHGLMPLKNSHCREGSRHINNYRTAWEYFSKRKSSVQTKRTWQPWRAFRTGFPKQAYLELGFEGWVGVLQEKEYSTQKEWQQHLCTLSVFPAGLCSLGPSAQSSAHGRCSAHISWTCRKNCTLKEKQKTVWVAAT